ncbi:flagellar motor switch protein FliG [Paeniglutamicibacter kerguelensis]|uniref:Flagellar motor switch protein FliG n=1 Tax=Paeniglutamicibacter kerguelensis TaxID=254788 RepID=A0ABS4XEG4_9MICC|nr:flagellar motor switch protein FliG [Paeniglutamicibacter kerguelensis]MBP2386855.1 flagellar motor switch protein FliG [Paeniglutamicibacter kerguelensis]
MKALGPGGTAMLSGTQKVAIVLMQMEKEHAAEVMKQFTEFEADEIAGELVRLRRVDAATVEDTIHEIHELATSGRLNARGGREMAVGLLEASFGSDKANTVMDRLSSSLAGMTFEFLDSAEPAQIVALLDGELPQTTALVVAHLRPEIGSAVLASFESHLRTDIARALATMGSASPEAVRVVAEALKKRTGAVMTPREPIEAVGGIQPLVEILNRSDVAIEKDLLQSLEQRDPQLAEEVRSRMLSFTDLVKFDRKDVQRVLRGINPTVLAFALKGAGSAVEATIRENISDRTKEVLDAEIESMGRVRVSQVEEARADIVRSIRELETTGEITIQRGDEDDFVL